MPNTTILGIVAIIVVGGVIYALRRYELRKIEELGRAEGRKEEREKDLDVLEKQTKILLEEKGIEDVARDLDAGNF